MAKNKSSPIWKISLEEFKKIISISKTLKEALSYFNLENKGNNYKTLYKRAKEENVDTTHFVKHYNNAGVYKKLSIECYLVENSNSSRSSIKKRIIKEKLIEYKCNECGLIDNWNNKKLSLHLDHINGINNDNRLENLRFLCPNCHSQTASYAGKKLKKKKEDLANYNKFQCFKCHKLKQGSALYCRKCLPNDKIIWPGKEELQKLVWEKATTKIAKELGVSDKAVEKRCKKYGIEKPPRGYWTKNK